MDFVVLGFGLGALAVLVGLGLRDLGPMLRRVTPGRTDLLWAEVARRVAWGRACRAAGLLVTLGGAALCLVTLLALVAGAGDGLGMGMVLGALVAAVAAVAGWSTMYRRQGASALGGWRGYGGAGGRSRRRGAANMAAGRRDARRGAGPAARPGRAGAGADRPRSAGATTGGTGPRPRTSRREGGAGPGASGAAEPPSGADAAGAPTRSGADETEVAPSRSKRRG